MKVSDGYLELVDKFIFMGTSLRHMRMTEEQKLRTMIAYEAYQVWMSNKQIKPTELCRRISARIYDDFLTKANHDPHYAELCEKLGIKLGKPRDYSKLANDVQTLDHIIGVFNRPTANIERAKVEDSSDWLISEGMKTGNGRDVKGGAELKMRLYKDFDEQQQGFDDLANTDINITGDVGVVKPGRINLTDDEKRNLAAQYGVSEKEVEDLVLNDEGMYETAPVEEEKEQDIYERNE
ncbi:hypothetical protein [Bacteroides sp.]|uniref:hypothetical protein n=1 Tax=Bacteroides sp. TaxID=29523 RepID=UPI0026020CB7|nr:hypothetical protein [Bacteroides sp.]MDD3037900.1 hypothetical protein [Bacteroides sp.]